MEKINFMKEALKEAQKALEIEEVPVGAVIVKDGEIIARAHNLKEKFQNPIYHAEVLAIEEACKKLNSWRLNGCEMYITLEPCPMCAGAIINSRLDKIYIGTTDEVMGACGTALNLLENYKFNHIVQVEKYILKEECENILNKFFDNLRRRNRKENG
ncbi:MAG: nucleoside deaminase [Clostridia bacterium]|nr:nucleoside deaminase [Clostridia bacterium]